MKVCKDYIKKQKREAKLLHLSYSPITVIIPCYNEPNILATLESLWNNENYQEQLHVIVVINHSEKSPPEAILQNQRTCTQLKSWKEHSETPLRTLSVLDIVFNDAESGVGAARKLGMDEAICQYIKNDKDGIILSLDADTLCAPNYLAEVYQHFQARPQTNTLIIQYQHQLDNIDTAQQDAIINYELYLRYMTLAYRYVNHPDAFHTIGSAFAVKVSAYCKQGGMNRRQAGEDFYFLQKMLLLGNCYELNTSCVFPSSRTSERVPFGTGKAVQELMTAKKELQTYSFTAFEELKLFFDQHTSLYKISKQDFENIVFNDLGGLIKSWLIEKDYFSELEKINANCASETMFSKKFFESFSIFQIIKYLNFTHTHFLRKIGIFHAISCLPEAEKLEFSTPKKLLFSLRELMNRESFCKR